MKTLSAALVTVLALALASLAVAYSGIVNVAASYPHSDVIQALIHAAMKQSVKRHAAEAPAPPSGLDGLQVQGGPLYREMCAQCHGGPGVDPDEVGKGLMPAAPDLTRETGEWTAKELFWIIKNGVRMTGMPAWGSTHSDEQIWAMTAFVLALPRMTPARYRELAGGAPIRLHEHEHSHRDDQPVTRSAEGDNHHHGTGAASAHPR